ncbi:hypothetical protein J1N10_05500 [Carboxylicivirga sp. A043]|uniref:OmpP1/FadL family transporter n=1 Tax=Carboxylicivirga litoralis TaxID=2816963 RepID=UPI0021CB1637|nr:outer membrane protein transport protein [Carboxylicivirga sp. A043]MCU4155421.1 hypothetical protein [Carboxylicivirga sp. A043]
MKKTLYTLFISCFFALTLTAQNLDDALRFNKREMTGTSRSLGMANAFGALGGDLSAISINPAGIAVYRTSEFAFTPSLSLNQSKASYGGLTDKDDKYSFPFNQIGGVSTYKPLREKDKGLISTHFGFTYTRTADFNENTSMFMGRGVQDSYDNTGYPTALNTLLNNIVWEANGKNPDEMSDRAYYTYEAYLFDPVEDGSIEYFSQYEDIDADGFIFDRNVNGIDQYNIIEREGYSGEYGFTFGANISHFLMLGTSINVQSFRYEQTESFREVNNNSFDPKGPKDVDYFDAYSKLSQKGIGVNGKFGIILNLHPIRLGASFHTPTFMEIDEEYNRGISSYFIDYRSFKKPFDASEFSYNYRTPYRAQGSLAFVLGKFGLISVDYEMTDHTSSKFNSSSYETMFKKINNDINEQMKITHDFRAGIEIKPVPYFALRAGAAYFDSPIKKEYTDVELTKWMATGGIGIRNKNFFFDVAYAYKFNEDNYYINTSDNSLLYGLSFSEPVNLEYRNHQASFTFGWKF